MTKQEAIQGVLSGTYKKVRARNFNDSAYIFLKDNSLYYKDKNGIDIYTDMSNLDDVSWDEAQVDWFLKIPNTGVLVFANNTLKRAMSFDGNTITFDDGSTEDVQNCSILNIEEMETLHKTIYDLA